MSNKGVILEGDGGGGGYNKQIWQNRKAITLFQSDLLIFFFKFILRFTFVFFLLFCCLIVFFLFLCHSHIHFFHLPIYHLLSVSFYFSAVQVIRDSNRLRNIATKIYICC